MADHLEDDEQVEALKRWWDENGRSTIVAVILAVGGTLGWQQYQGWDAQQTAAAADTWAQAEAALNADVPSLQAEGEWLAQNLIDTHSNTTYAQFAGMVLAKRAVEKGELSAAEQYLRDALAAGDSQSELGQLIQLRLARVLAATGEESAALAILNQSNGSLPAAYAIARGDLHLAAGRQREALNAYLEARAATLDLGSPPGLLEAKITSLESRLANEEQSS